MYLNVEINYCLNLSFDDLQKYAAENYQKVYRHISSTYEKEKATTLLISSLFMIYLSKNLANFSIIISYFFIFVNDFFRL